MPENDLAKEAAKPPEPDEATLRTRALEDRLARMEADNQRLYAAVESSRRQAPPPPPQVDPYDKFKTDLSLPDEAKEALDQGTRLRVRQEVGRAANALEDRRKQELFETEMRLAYNMMMQNNADMATDEEGVVAAAALADYEILKKGERLDPSAYYSRVISKYRQSHPKPAPAPAYVEGSGPANAQRPMGQPAPETPTANSYEEDYGFDPGEIKDLREGGKQLMGTMADRYAIEKNTNLEKKGIYSNLVEVVGPMKKHRKEQAAAAAGK